MRIDQARYHCSTTDIHYLGSGRGGGAGLRFGSHRDKSSVSDDRCLRYRIALIDRADVGIEDDDVFG